MMVNGVRSKVEEIKINLKRRIENSPQAVKKNLSRKHYIKCVYRMFSKKIFT